MKSDLKTRLAESWPPQDWADVTVLAAVSGGADSVALLRALASLKAEAGGAGQLVAAHFNHRLRPQADLDEQFVVELCRRLGLVCEAGRGEVGALAAEQGDGLEAAARRMRYEFLQATAERLGARYVATAHTADDQAETILFRILRGTGIAGLRGMPRVRPLGPPATLVRPMLSIRRSEVEAYLVSLGQAFCDDLSNADRRFARNRIRHDLLPRLARDYGRDVVGSILRLGAAATDAQHAVLALVEPLVERAVTYCDDGAVAIDCRLLAAHARHVVREVFVRVWQQRGWPLQAMGQGEWDTLAVMALESGAAAATKRVMPGGVTVERTAEAMRLSR